jgi:hypothetical protein
MSEPPERKDEEFIFISTEREGGGGGAHTPTVCHCSLCLSDCESDRFAFEPAAGVILFSFQLSISTRAETTECTATPQCNLYVEQK